MLIIGHIPQLVLFLLLSIMLHLPASEAWSSRNGSSLTAQLLTVEQAAIGLAPDEVRKPSHATQLSEGQEPTSRSVVTTPGLQILPSDDVYLLNNVPIPLVARVTDSTGQPMPAVTVTFQITEGDGILADGQALAQVLTNEQGDAITHITVPTVLQTTCINASAMGFSPVTAKFTGVPETLLRLIKDSGDDQTAPQNQILEEPFVVRVEGQFPPIVAPCEPPTDPSGLQVAQSQSKASRNHQSIHQELVTVPVAGVRVTAEIIQGDPHFVSLPGQSISERMAETLTNAQGEARFLIRVGTENAVTRVTSDLAPDDEVDFFTFVGFAKLTDIAVEENRNLVVTDAGLRAVIRVDPSSGRRTLVSGDGRGEGPPFAEPLGIAVEGNGSLVVVGRVKGDAGPEPYAVIRVDPVTGHRTVISSHTDPQIPDGPPIGSGPGFERPRDIAVGNDGTLWVVDGDHGLGLHAVVKLESDPMNPNIWNRTIFSGVDPDMGESRGSGPGMFFPRDIAVAADNTLLVAGLWSNKLDTNCHDENSNDDCFDGVVRIDPNGDRAVIAREEPGRYESSLCPTLGPLGDIGALDGIAIEESGTLVILNNRNAYQNSSPAIRVDPRITSPDNSCLVVAEDTNSFISDVGFLTPTGISIDDADNTLVVVDASSNAVIRINPGTGERNIVSRGTSVGQGRRLLIPKAVAVEAEGNLIVVDNHDQTVIRVDPTTGDRTTVSGCQDINCANADRIGDSEPPFTTYVWDAVLSDNSLFMVSEVTTSDTYNPRFPAVMRVNLQDGTREVLSGCPEEEGQCLFGSGPPLIEPLAIAVATDHLVVTENGTDRQAVVRIDLTTGNRTMVSGCLNLDCTDERGSGPPLINPNGIAINANRYLVVDGGADGYPRVVWGVERDTGNRTVVSGCVDFQCTNMIGNGPHIRIPSAIALEAMDTLVLIKSLTEFTALVRVNMKSGNRTFVSSNPFLRTAPVQEVAAMTYWDTENVFLLADRATALFRLTPEGTATLVGFMDHESRGLVFSADPMPVLYSISVNGGHLKVINPADAATVSEVSVTIESDTVSGAYGLATHPSSGQLWALLTRGDSTELELATINPTTGAASRIGNTHSRFVGLAFDANGTLYSMTEVPGNLRDWSLYTLNTTDAMPTCVLPMNNTDEGKAIAFNSMDQHLYHAAYPGYGPSFFESINVLPSSTCDTPVATTMPIPLTFSGKGRGSGPLFVTPVRLDVDANGDLMVVDRGLQAVLRVNTITGDRTIVSR